MNDKIGNVTVIATSHTPISKDRDTKEKRLLTIKRCSNSLWGTRKAIQLGNVH